MSNLNELINNGMLKYADKKGMSIEKLPFTNADKIRSMSDEELAEFLELLQVDCSEIRCKNCQLENIKYCDCSSRLEWLQSEV